MSRVFWDSNLFIYMFEGYGVLSQQVLALRRAMLERGDQLITSTLALGEVLVKPIERGQDALRLRFEEAIAGSAMLVPFSAGAAQIYAKLRSERVKGADAIHLACAAEVGVDLFVTNDERLHKVRVKGIQFIVPLARAPI